VVEKQRVTIALQRQQISRLTEDRVFLLGEVDYRDKVISGLRETVRDREAELIALRDEPEAEVHHMPRRVLAEHEPIWQELNPSDDTDAELSPAVVDIKINEKVMPDYEAERQLA
jgi:hypothetical protein